MTAKQLYENAQIGGTREINRDTDRRIRRNI
jgi:hypothetical protein